MCFLFRNRGKMGQPDPDPGCLVTSEKHTELTTDAQRQISERSDWESAAGR